MNKQSIPHKAMKMLAGQTFGQWLVLDAWFRVPTPRKQRQTTEIFWLCRCSCGVEKQIRAAALMRKESRKCRKCAGWDGEFPKRAAYKSCRTNAAARNLSCDLTIEQFLELAVKDCFYCGASPSNSRKSPGCKEFLYNGMDRVDNNLGYSCENCVPCCSSCNSAKGEETQTDFIERCKRIARRFS